jgi:tetratricopeptide (TPR) repeat protein
MPEDPQKSILRGRLRSALPPPPSAVQAGKILRLPASEPDYGSALERSARKLLQRQIALDRERADSCTLVPELLAHGRERQPLLLRNDSRLHTWGVLERLLEHGLEVLPRDRRESERLAGLALDQSRHLDASYYGLTRVEDMRARAWVAIAEARRLRSDFAGADEAFTRARGHLAAGTGDTLEWAFLLDSEAALRRCQGRFADARQLLQQALETFVENGEDQRATLALVTLAAVHREGGQTDLSLSLLQDAARRVDGDREPRLLLSVEHNLAESLAAAGRLMEARGILIRSRPLYRRFPDSWTQAHLRWLRGRVATGLGQTAEAEADLRGARSAFLALDALFEAALVALDLAPVYLQQDRAAELVPLAAETLEVFRSCGVERARRAATAWLRQAEELAAEQRDVVAAVGAAAE